MSGLLNTSAGCLQTSCNSRASQLTVHGQLLTGHGWVFQVVWQQEINVL